VSTRNVIQCAFGGIDDKQLGANIYALWMNGFQRLGQASFVLADNYDRN
jgi:hypothetical protein